MAKSTEQRPEFLDIIKYLSDSEFAKFESVDEIKQNLTYLFETLCDYYNLKGKSISFAPAEGAAGYATGEDVVVDTIRLGMTHDEYICAMATIFHETFHMFQFSCALLRQNEVSSEFWDILTKYRTVYFPLVETCGEKDIGFLQYRFGYLERDAYRFEDTMLKKCFKFLTKRGFDPDDLCDLQYMIYEADWHFNKQYKAARKQFGGGEAVVEKINTRSKIDWYNEIVHRNDELFIWTQLYGYDKTYSMLDDKVASGAVIHKFIAPNLPQRISKKFIQEAEEIFRQCCPHMFSRKNQALRAKGLPVGLRQPFFNDKNKAATETAPAENVIEIAPKLDETKKAAETKKPTQPKNKKPTTADADASM